MSHQISNAISPARLSLELPKMLWYEKEKKARNVIRMELPNDRLLQISEAACWSSGMVLVSCTRGPGFDFWTAQNVLLTWAATALLTMHKVSVCNRSWMKTEHSHTIKIVSLFVYRFIDYFFFLKVCLRSILSYTAFPDFVKFIPAHSLILSCERFCCRPRFLSPLTCRCMIVLTASHIPYLRNLCFIYMVRRSSYGPIAAMNLCRTSSSIVVKICWILQKHRNSKARFLRSISATRVQVSQAQGNMDPRRECITLILTMRQMILSVRVTFSLAITVVACAILERTSGLDPWSEQIDARFLMRLTYPNLGHWISICFLTPLGLLVIAFVLLLCKS